MANGSLPTDQDLPTKFLYEQADSSVTDFAGLVLKCQEIECDLSRIVLKEVLIFWSHEKEP